MIRRLLRSAIVLAVLVAAYNAYVLLAVPQMEPRLADGNRPRINPGDMPSGEMSVSKYQLLLSNYFPKDHWSQTRQPKVIANSTEQAMLVFDDFKQQPGSGQNPDGSPTTRVDIERIAVLMFPTPPREGLAAPRDAIILESPQGARFEFDEFRPEMGKIGKIVRGDFPGPIHIHSDMQEPGPQDDLSIEVSDLIMNTKLLYTSKPDSPVRFRMGQNVGGGTDLEIRFMTDEHMKPSDTGLRIAGYESLEIRRNVKMRLQLDTSHLLPGNKQEQATAGKKDADPYSANPSVKVADATAVTPAAEKPPVEVTCSGPFTFNAVQYIASLDRDVELRQINPNGPSDQLMCSRLDIHFARKPTADGREPAIVSDAGKRQQKDLGQLEPVAMVAEGHPAVMTSPAQNGQARGDNITMWIKQQRIRISGGNDAMLVFGPNVLQAPIIDYQHPTREEGTSIGRFAATGPGSLRYVIDEKKPDQILQAQWQKSVLLGREKGQPVLALDGRPKVAFGTAGTLMADQIRMYLRELEGKGTAGIAIGSGGDNKGGAGKEGDAQNKLRLAPDRLLATGSVEIASPKFTGHTQQLSTSFRIDPESAPAGSPSANPGAGPAKSGKAPTVPGTGNSPNAAPPNDQSSQSYDIEADQMRLEVFLKGQTAVPSALACDGHIHMKEMPQTPSDQQPLEIRGGQLLVDRLDTNTPHITLHGVAPGQAPGAALAQMAGRGMTMLVDTVEADGGGSRVWSDGPGKATMLVARNLTGQQTATPFPMDVTWQNGFRFDGQTIAFNQNVVVAGMDSTVRCDRLTAKLAGKLQPGQPMNQANMNMSEIECSGQVTLDHIARDTAGLTSHAIMQLTRLAINQQTGAIKGDGPGVIRATHFGNGLATIPGQPGAPPQPVAAAPANGPGNKLFFLRVDFHSGLDGNMYTRELTFHDRVRAVYGPVDSWEQELDPTRPESLPPDSITLACDDLRLNEDPLAARVAANPNNGNKQSAGPMQVQMQAKGNVRIAGQVPGQGEFSVQADRATYEKAKETFVLEGDTRSPAKLWRRNAAGKDSPPLEAGLIRYMRTTNQAMVDRIQYFEITPNDLQNAQRPKTAPK